MTPDARASAAAGASSSKAIRRRSACTAMCRTAYRQRASSTTCRCFSTLALHRDVSAAVTDFWRDINSRYRMQGGDPDRPLLAPPQMFVPAEEFFLRAKDHPRIDVQETDEAGEGPLATTVLPPLAVDRRAQDPLVGLKAFLADSKLRVLVAAESPGRRETMV